MDFLLMVFRIFRSIHGNIRIQMKNDIFSYFFSKYYFSMMTYIVIVSFFCFRWRKYRNLWIFDKDITCDKFAAKNPTVVAYDEKFLFYTRVMTELDECQKYVDIYCIR